MAEDVDMELEKLAQLEALTDAEKRDWVALRRNIVLRKVLGAELRGLEELKLQLVGSKLYSPEGVAAALQLQGEIKGVFALMDRLLKITPDKDEPNA